MIAPLATVRHAAGVSRELLLASLLALWSAAGCGGCGRSGVLLPEPVHLQHLLVVPEQATLTIGQPFRPRVIAVFDDAPSRELDEAEVAWHQPDSDALVLESGVWTASKAVERVHFVASFEGLESSSTVRVVDSPVVTASVTPLAESVAVGASLPLRFERLLETGLVLDDTFASLGTTWSSSDPAVASVTSDGVVTALAAASWVTITASNGTSTARARLRITATPIHPIRLELVPGAMTLETGSSRSLRAWLRFDDGSARDVSDDSHTSWSTSSVETVAIGAEGLAKAGANAGDAFVSVMHERLRAAARVRVSEAPLTRLGLAGPARAVPVGGVFPLSLRGRYADRHEQELSTDPRVAWTSSDPSVVEVWGGEAHVRAPGGPVRLRAELAGQSAELELPIRPDRLRSISLVPERDEVDLWSSSGIELRAVFDDGSTQTVDLVADRQAISFDPPGLVELDAEGRLFAARAGGPVTLRASWGGLETNTVVRVVPRAEQVASLRFDPSQLVVPAGGSSPLKLVATYGDGREAPIPPDAKAVLSSADPRTARVGAEPVVEGVRVGGPVQVVGVYQGLRALAAVGVEAEEKPRALDCEPRSIGGRVGRRVRLMVTATGADGVVRDVTHDSRTTYVFASPDVARVQDGVVYLAAAGSTTLTIAHQGASVLTAVDVGARALSSLAVSSSSLELRADTSDRISVVGTYEDGSSADLTPEILGTTYATSNSAVVSLSGDGRFTALEPGEASITISNGGLSRRVTVYVRADAAVNGASVNPPKLSLDAGTSLQASCAAMLANERLVDVTRSRAVRWLSLDPVVASVDAAGLVQGRREGSARVACLFGGAVGFSVVVVSPPALVQRAIEPRQAVVPAGAFLPISVFGVRTDGSVDGLSSLASFESSEPAAAPVSSDGVVSGLAMTEGARITSSVGGTSLGTEVRVVEAAPEQLRCVPERLTLLAGEVASLALEATLTDGSDATALTPTWQAPAGAGFELDDRGLVRATQPGRFVAFGTVGGLVARCPVEIRP